MKATRSAPRERERERARTTSGSDQVHSWILVPSQVLHAAWRIARASVMTALSLLSATLSYFRSLYLYLGHQLKWWIGYLQRKFKSKYLVHVFSLLRAERGPGGRGIGKLTAFYSVLPRKPQCGGRSRSTQLLCKRVEGRNPACQADEEGL